MPAEQRTDGEDGQTSHEKALAAESAGEPSADGQNDGIRDEIRSQHPGALVVARAQIAGHIGQRDVGDAGVEHLHERGQRHDHGDQPRIVLGPPDVLVDVQLTAVLIGGTRPAPRSCPGRSWRSLFSPGSRTIFTGMRWTILT